MSSTKHSSQQFEHNVFEEFFDIHRNRLASSSPRSPSRMNDSRETSYDQLPIMNDRGSSPDSSMFGDPTPQKSIGTDTKKSPDTRRVQNRKAQRAFRARQKQHVEGLEEKLQSILSDYEELQQNYNRLRGDYSSLLQKQEEVLPTEMLEFTQGWKANTVEGQDGLFEDFLLLDEPLKWNTLSVVGKVIWKGCEIMLQVSSRRRYTRLGRNMLAFGKDVGSN